MRVRLEGLSFGFRNANGHFPVLNAIDLEVAPGEFVAVLGPSGCGKSTLLNLVAGVLAPESGAIWLDGKTVPNVRAEAGYLQQKDLLLPWRRALANALLGAQLQGADLGRAAKEAKALFERFGLSGLERRYPAELSGGQRQRVALVRTLLARRPLLLLDEPFGALDVLTRMRLHDWLLEAWGAFGKTILMVTHDLDEALVLADRIVVLGPRPARVARVFEVSLARPRARMGLEFARLKHALWQQVSGVLARA